MFPTSLFIFVVYFFFADGITGKETPYISYHVLIYRLDRRPVGFSGLLDTAFLSRHCLGLFPTTGISFYSESIDLIPLITSLSSGQYPVIKVLNCI